MSTRGKIALHEQGSLWRVYDTWASLKGERREQIDLCHFMRVVLFWAWMRMFFQQPIFGNSGLTPAILCGVCAVLSALVTAAILWTHVFLTALAVAAAVVTFVALVFLLAYGIMTWRKVDPERVDKFFYWALIWLWGPFYLAGLGCIRIYHVALYPAGEWLINKRLFYSHRLTTWFTPLGIVMLAAAIVLSGLGLYGIVLAFLHDWQKASVIAGLIFAAVVALVGLLFAIVKVAEYEKSRTYKADEDTGPKHETLSTIWAYAVSKKHRICPLIEVKP